MQKKFFLAKPAWASPFNSSSCSGGGPRHHGLPGWRLRLSLHSFVPFRPCPRPWETFSSCGQYCSGHRVRYSGGVSHWRRKSAAAEQGWLLDSVKISHMSILNPGCNVNESVQWIWIPRLHSMTNWPSLSLKYVLAVVGNWVSWCFTPSQPVRLYQGDTITISITIYFIHPSGKLN